MNTHDFKNTHWTRCPLTGPAELHFAEAALRRTQQTEDAIKADMLDYYHRTGMPIPEDLRVLLGITDTDTP